MFFVLYAAGGLDRVRGNSLYVEDDIVYIKNARGGYAAIFSLDSIVGIIRADALTEDDSQKLGLSDESSE